VLDEFFILPAVYFGKDLSQNMSETHGGRQRKDFVRACATGSLWVKINFARTTLAVGEG
jgi:hypothetical protein